MILGLECHPKKTKKKTKKIKKTKKKTKKTQKNQKKTVATPKLVNWLGFFWFFLVFFGVSIPPPPFNATGQDVKFGVMTHGHTSEFHWHCGSTVAALSWHCGGTLAALWRHSRGTVAALSWHCGGTLAALFALRRTFRHCQNLGKFIRGGTHGSPKEYQLLQKIGKLALTCRLHFVGETTKGLKSKFYVLR